MFHWYYCPSPVIDWQPSSVLTSESSESIRETPGSLISCQNLYRTFRVIKGIVYQKSKFCHVSNPTKLIPPHFIVNSSDTKLFLQKISIVIAHGSICSLLTCPSTCSLAIIPVRGVDIAQGHLLSFVPTALAEHIMHPWFALALGHVEKACLNESL